MAPFVDVTALEIEVKGESTPLNVVLHPYATHVPGKNLVGTRLKKMITVTKYEPQHEIFNNVVCAISKGSDQPAHTHILIRAFGSHWNIL